jgi:hypothetical protein
MSPVRRVVHTGAAPPCASARPLGIRVHRPHSEAAPSPGRAHTEATRIPRSPTPRRCFTRRLFGVPLSRMPVDAALLRHWSRDTPVRRDSWDRRATCLSRGKRPSRASHARPRCSASTLLPVLPPLERHLLRPSPSQPAPQTHPLGLLGPSTALNCPASLRTSPESGPHSLGLAAGARRCSLRRHHRT